MTLYIDNYHFYYPFITIHFLSYRIYIPSGTWSFNLTIWNCSSTLQTLHNIHVLCIKSISLKGRALPIFDHSEKSVNLTIHTSHTFVESSPYEDSYYYLAIISSSVIKFSVKVDISGNFESCIKIIETLRKYREMTNIANTLRNVAATLLDCKQH